MTVRPHVRALAPYRFKALPQRIKLDQNEAPEDLPEALKRQALERLLTLPWNRYSEMHADSLRRALAAHHDWPEEGIVVSGGSNVLLQALVIACGIGQRVLTVKPSFAVYSMQAEIMGAELTEVPLEPDFSLPLEALKTELQRGTGVLFLANPAAPTGNLFSEAQLRELITAAGDWTVVIDEAYYQFSGSDFKHLAKEYPNVLSLRTLSKAFGLGGVRIGYTLASRDLAENLQKVIMPFSVSTLQIAVGLTVLEHPHYTQNYIATVQAERERMRKNLLRLGLEVFPSVTNFFLFRVRDAERFYKGLLAHDVLVRRQDHLPGLEGCLRVSVGKPDENSRFLAAAAAVSESERVRG